MTDYHESHDPAIEIEQLSLVHGHGQSATLGHGTQNNIFVERPVSRSENRASISVPVGRLSRTHPVRGRAGLVSAIEATFEKGSDSHVQVIHGLAGSGKTSVALEIASHVESAGAQVWWIHGADASAVATGMMAVATHIGVTEVELAQGDAADALWRRLRNLNQRWLLIVDNVNDPAILTAQAGSFADGTGWIRPDVGPQGNVLITSRLATPSAWGQWCTLHQVKMLPDDDGGRMLLDYVPSLSSSAEHAKTLSARLGGLPLALRLAGLYLADTTTNPWPEPNSIVTFEAYRDSIVDGLLPGSEARDKFSQTWNLSLGLLEQRGFTHAPSLLYLLSLFAETRLPFQKILDPITLAERPPFEGINGIHLWKTINALSDLGMIDYVVRQNSSLSTTHYLKIHPLVQHITRISESPGASKAYYLDTASILVHRALAHAEIGDPNDTDSWETWNDVVPHYRQLLATTLLGAATEGAVYQLVGDSCKVSNYLIVRGLQEDAESIGRMSVDAAEASLGSGDLLTIHAHLDLAEVLYRRCKYDEADTQFMLVMEHEADIANDEPGMSEDIRHSYGHFLAERGELATAESLLRTVLNEQVQRLGADSNQALTLKHCLASVLRSQGRLPEALVYYENVLNERTNVLGEKHRLTMQARHNYAHVIDGMGEHDKAEQLHRRLIEDQTAAFGADDRSTINTRHCLAHVFARRNDLVSATTEVRVALEGGRKIYGETHPWTLDLRRCLATLLGSQQQTAAAKEEILAIIDLCSSSLGAEHGSTLRARHELGHMLSDSGDSIGAQKEFSILHATQARILGHKHLDTRGTKSCLEAEKRKAARLAGSYPVHGGGKGKGTRRGKKKRNR